MKFWKVLWSIKFDENFICTRSIRLAYFLKKFERTDSLKILHVGDGTFLQKKNGERHEYSHQNSLSRLKINTSSKYYVNSKLFRSEWWNSSNECELGCNTASIVPCVAFGAPTTTDWELQKSGVKRHCFWKRAISPILELLVIKRWAQYYYLLPMDLHLWGTGWFI